MARLQRLLSNLFDGWFQLRRRFPPTLLDEITAAISQGEARHQGEVRLAIESRLSPLAVLRGLDTPRRAAEAFAYLRVWNTEHNNGVLLYVLMAEHRIEIVADRGIAKRVTQVEWDTICATMRDAFARGLWREGALGGIAAVHALLTRHFPNETATKTDELPDRPILL